MGFRDAADGRLKGQHSWQVCHNNKYRLGVRSGLYPKRRHLPTVVLLEKTLPEPQQRTRGHAHLGRKHASEVRLIRETSFCGGLS